MCHVENGEKVNCCFLACSAQCVPIGGRGFRLGQYCCRCKDGYYNPDTADQDAGTIWPARNPVRSALPLGPFPRLRLPAELLT